MCSRYSLTSPPEAVRATFGYDTEVVFPPRYNIAPTQPVAIVRTGLKGTRELALVRWGLIPSWSKDPAKLSTLINARSETAAEKPSFRGALRHRRCLIPADGFYEWTGKPGAKQPHLIGLKSGAIMGFAGVWEHWLGADGSEMETAAILTVAANADMVPIHDRMPLILPEAAFDGWLDCRSGSSVDIQPFLHPPADGLLRIVAVSRTLNNPRNEGPGVQERVGGALL
ncbi:MAG: SOS response-associated peptidase [Hyphomicrobiaceae bacterium]|nr:SOS response-associated peptidase [Hyphomicrobiaceae bacterium]